MLLPVHLFRPRKVERRILSKDWISVFYGWLAVSGAILLLLAC